MATSTQHIAARNDPDLLARFVAIAEQVGIPNASAWVQSHMGELVSQEVEGTQTVADVYAYADDVRNQYLAATPDRPGINLGAVTDAHLSDAIDTVNGIPTP